jgi:hypothetical protein
LQEHCVLLLPQLTSTDLTLWKLEVTQIMHTNSVPTSQKTYYICITNANCLVQKIIAAYCMNHTRHINTLYEFSADVKAWSTQNRRTVVPWRAEGNVFVLSWKCYEWSHNWSTMDWKLQVHYAVMSQM